MNNDNNWRRRLALDLILRGYTKGKNTRVLSKALGQKVQYGRTRYPGLYRAIRKFEEEPNWKYNLDKNVPIAYKNAGWTHYTNDGILYNGTNFFKVDKKSGRRKQVAPVNMNRLIPRKSDQTWQGYTNRARKYVKNLREENVRGKLLQNINNTIRRRAPLNKFTTDQLINYMTRHPRATMARALQGGFYYKDPNTQNWVRVSNRTKINRQNILENIKTLFK